MRNTMSWKLFGLEQSIKSTARNVTIKYERLYAVKEIKKKW